MSDLFNLAENFAKNCEQTAESTEQVAKNAIKKLEQSLILDLEKSGHTIRNAITESERAVLTLSQQRGLISELESRQADLINNMNQYSELMTAESAKAQSLMMESMKESQKQINQSILDTNQKYRRMILGGWKYLAYTIGGVILLALIIMGVLGMKINNQINTLSEQNQKIEEIQEDYQLFMQRIDNLQEKVFSCTDSDKKPFACVEVKKRRITAQGGIELIEINLPLPPKQ